MVQNGPPLKGPEHKQRQKKDKYKGYLREENRKDKRREIEAQRGKLEWWEEKSVNLFGCVESSIEGVRKKTNKIGFAESEIQGE